MSAEIVRKVSGRRLAPENDGNQRLCEGLSVLLFFFFFSFLMCLSAISVCLLERQNKEAKNLILLH